MFTLINILFINDKLYTHVHPNKGIDGEMSYSIPLSSVIFYKKKQDKMITRFIVAATARLDVARLTQTGTRAARTRH